MFLPVSIEAIHPDLLPLPRAVVQATLCHCAAAALARLEEFAQLFLANLDGLCGSGIAHACHWAPEIESVCNIRTDSEEN